MTGAKLLSISIIVLVGTVCAGLNFSAEGTPGAGVAREPRSSPEWFAEDSVWNQALSPTARRSPLSEPYVGELLRQVRDFGAWVNTDEYSTPVYTVGPGQPRVPVTLRPVNGGGVTPSLQAALSSVPIPAAARPARGTDHHLVVWQPSTDEMWEFWVLRREDGGWVAAFGGAMRNVSENPGYYDPNAWPGAEDDWGATASSLPLLGGLMTIEELRSGRIEHALALAIPEPSPEFVWPAQRSDGESVAPTAIPEGTDFRLPADLDLEGLDLPPAALTMARAAQEYGMIVRDRSGVVSLYGEAPLGSGNPYGEIFENLFPDALLEHFPWSELEVVEPDPLAAAGLQVTPGYPLWAAPPP
jgi:hypothetical protein